MENADINFRNLTPFGFPEKIFEKAETLTEGLKDGKVVFETGKSEINHSVDARAIFKNRFGVSTVAFGTKVEGKMELTGRLSISPAKGESSGTLEAKVTGTVKAGNYIRPLNLISIPISTIEINIDETVNVLTLGKKDE